MADTFDLLGLGPAPTVPAASAAPAVSTSALAEKPPLRKVPKDAEPVIAYPSALEQNVVPQDNSADQLPEAVGQKRYTVRCEGRWRVRSAPSLSSKVIGTIANGTIVVGEDVHGEISGPGAMLDPSQSSVPEALNEAMRSITALWVRVIRLEAQEPMGVSEIKRDSATGGELYCLRRNAMGYGLYQAGVEPLNGQLITLPENLAVELRLDAQRAASDKTEDVSLTWKLLGAAESIGQFFSSSAEDEAGINEDIKPTCRRRPEDMFEVKQREQLKKAAASLRAPVEKLVAKARDEAIPPAGPGDLFGGMTKEIGRRFARLRSSLSQSTSSSGSLVVSTYPGQEEMTGPVDNDGNTLAVAEGSIDELQSFTVLCERIERTGGWSGMSLELRREFLNFSVKHARDIETFVRARCKGHVGGDSPSSRRNGPVSPSLSPASPSGADSGMLGDLLSEPTKPAAVAGGGYAAATGSALAFLPPPPKSACSVGSNRLV
eukprot:TRINITY_DN29269_c0_g1_i1.p1 TRINITY_DN29269_c0_g1~~TRINITY_DN29269_c0_g1_i1.p1  ORF type:complete len:490 (-),score=110.35 TRINITY_DN29269_c0_g1_i1:79-1548(-)